MKTSIYFSFAFTIILCAGIFSACGQTIDPVKKANDLNEKKAEAKLIDKEIADFLVKSADARMMSGREGKLAAEKGTTAEIREYGKWMVKDQETLLEEIKKLAAQLSITLPTDISKEKQKALNDLESKTGKEFDKKFIKMITIDHERDIKLFEKAIGYEEKSVSDFAKKYLPIIQSHLDKINEIHMVENEK